MLKTIPVPEYEGQVTKEGIAFSKESSTPWTTDLK
jgi:hypothetical protein